MPDKSEHIDELEKLVEENRKAFEPPRPRMRVTDDELLAATTVTNGG